MTDPRNSGPTTPVKRGRGRNPKPHSDISVESPYFSPSKKRSPRSKGETFLIDERRLQYTDGSLDSQNYASESDDPFEATQTRIPAFHASVAGLYRQLALCKPYLIQGVIFLSLLWLSRSLSNSRMPFWRSMEGPCSCHITQQNIWKVRYSRLLDFDFEVADSARAISR